MTEITVNEQARGARDLKQYRRGSLKNQGNTHAAKKSFFAFALNIGFFLCYFRRRVEFVGKYCPR